MPGGMSMCLEEGADLGRGIRACVRAHMNASGCARVYVFVLLFSERAGLFIQRQATSQAW